MLLRHSRRFCTTPREVKTRVVSFSLPSRPPEPRPKTETPKPAEETVSDTPEPTDLPKVSSGHQLDEFFPSSMLTPQPDELDQVQLVKRPHLWVSPSSTLSVTDTGRYLRYQRDELVRLMPEGLAGETARDIYLMPSRTRDIGIMYRKSTNELIHQLGRFEGMNHIPRAGWLLEGKRGVGKSSIMNAVVAWARQRGNWLVMFEPLGSRFGKEVTEIVRSNSGLYLQNELSVQFLERFIQFNGDLLETVPVDMLHYGRTSLDSSPIETIERVYLPLIEKRVEKSGGLVEKIEKVHSTRQSLVLPSMKSKLPTPSNLLALVEFGISNPTFATQTVAELIAQLKVQSTYPVLVAVDEWNEMFVVSEYVSARYDNTVFNGYIPNYHLALSRMLSRWDGHEYKRGVKLFSTSWNRRNRRQFDPEILGVKPEEIKQIRNFTKHEFANYCAYQAITNTSHRFPEDRLEYFYMLTQGNGYEARKMMATFY
jgi:small subunit ribosomal protein S29